MGDQASDQTVPFDLDPLVGVMLARRYRVLQRLRRGGIGDRYLAKDVDNAESLAIEVMRIDLIGAGVELDEIEAALARIPDETLVHANIVGVIDCGRCPDERLFFAMPWIEKGIDCATWLELCGPQPPATVASVLVGAAAGIDAIHQAGRVHGDVKSANVVLADVAGSEMSVVVDSAFALRTQLW